MGDTSDRPRRRSCPRRIGWKIEDELRISDALTRLESHLISTGDRTGHLICQRV